VTTPLAAPSPAATGEPADGQGSRGTVAGVVVAALIVLALAAVVVNARNGVDAAESARIANRAVTGAPRPVTPLWGRTDWIRLHQIGTILMMILLVGGFVVAWRRHPKHPILLMVVVTTTLIWQDPIMNWAPYAVYNPQLWHWPETWPLVSLSPTVEPFIVVGYAAFQMAAYFPAIWILRRLQARRPSTSFVWRHPLISLALLLLPIGMVIDAFLEIFLVRTQLYIYSQVMPFGAFAAGRWYQFPFIWETVMVTFVMIPAGVLLYRDDTGKAQAEKLAMKVRWFRGRPALGTFLVMFAIINAAYFAYGAGYALIRATGSATSVACPWPFPEAKVYDPQGYYEEAGQPGPYYPGIWSGWESGQPGRPDVDQPAGGGRCSTGSG
jgi:hypothetical protein